MDVKAGDDRFEPDPRQLAVLRHERGPMLVTGAPGTGKTAVLRERMARLIEGRADPERVAMVVGNRDARARVRAAVLERLRRPLPVARVLTVHGLANLVLAERFAVLGYQRPPTLMTAFDQFARVQDLLRGEDPDEWPTFHPMLRLRGFADQVRRFLLRAQEALRTPEAVARQAQARGAAGWEELAGFYGRYLDGLALEHQVDFAGLVAQAARAAELTPPEEAPFDHVMVDDFQDATLAEEALVVHAARGSLVVAGDPGSHVFSFQGTTDAPIERFPRNVPGASHVELITPHRSPRPPTVLAWSTRHTSEEHAAIARELRRRHVEDGVPWREMAVVVRRQGSHVGGLLRALDDATVPRFVPQSALTLLVEPSAYPYLLALRWLAHRDDPDSLIEPILTSDLAGLSPASARGLVRLAKAAGQPQRAALERDDGLAPDERERLATLREVLADAEAVAARSVHDTFRILWTRLPCSARIVEEASRSAQGATRLAAVLAFADAVARTEEGSEHSVGAFLDLLEAGREGPGAVLAEGDGGREAVRVLTAHGTAGLEFDTVVVAGAVEGNFPSLARPEPMFDLELLEGSTGQAERNRRRLADERRLFDVVLTRARRRVVLAASDPHGEDELLSARSRFVAERGVAWRQAPVAPFDEPVSVAEAMATWRRTLADPAAPRAQRLAALDGVLALGAEPTRWWFRRDWTGTERALHETIRTSYSKLGTLENCSLQYLLSHELGLEDRAGFHAWVGNLVHRLIEACENGSIPRSLDALTRLANGRWRPEEFPSHAVSEAFRRLVVERMIPAWFDEYGADASKAWATEVRFGFPFEGAEITGYIDRIGRVQGGGSQIVDYKTGRKSADASRPEESLQLGMYYLAVNRAEDLAPYRPVRAVALAFLRETPTRRDRDAPMGAFATACLAITPSLRDEYERTMTDRLSTLIARIRELLETETYRPSATADCHFCRFKTLCPMFPEGRGIFPAVAPGRAVPA